MINAFFDGLIRGVLVASALAGGFWGCVYGSLVVYRKLIKGRRNGDGK